jgi:hypothetical protein
MIKKNEKIILKIYHEPKKLTTRSRQLDKKPRCTLF